MKVTILAAALMLVASIPYINGDIPSPAKKIAPTRLSAQEYIDQMGPNVSSWKKAVKVQQASAEPQ
ncbi:MAG TPA: hypothetical protein VN665_01615 [Candidatus Paceibacterota bacterium]|nr:hypothetical protein [Candidatus Paceibacterota bacterium]